MSHMMNSVEARCVGHVNATYRRTGTIWEGRHHTCQVDTDTHVVPACRFIDLNPLRARMVAHPIDRAWSRYGAQAGIRDDAFVAQHDSLAWLGDAPGPGYAMRCGAGVREDELEALRAASAREFTFGSDVFRACIQAMTSRATSRERPGPRGARGRVAVRKTTAPIPHSRPRRRMVERSRSTLASRSTRTVAACPAPKH